MRENAHDKARRLLTEGRLTIRSISVDTITAAVRGDSARIYQVGWDPASAWWCSCPAVGPRCSHVQALQLVTLQPLPPLIEGTAR